MGKPTLQDIKRQFGIIGKAKSLHHAIEVAMQVAPTHMSILINGENGSGKESFSKIIHHLSPYKHGNLIPINCGAIPEGTIDSELFGHEKGAFTGAGEMRKGYFEEAHEGTIFLDEIGELPLGTQARLLRVLEYGEYIKVGSSKVQKVEVRVIAATHRDLLKAVAQGKFREDLYYRINTVPIRIPPLRERGDDILLLFRKFALDFADEYYVKPIQLTPEAQEVLKKYPFPGNIRQLKNLAVQLSALARQEPLVSAQTMATYLPPIPTYLPAPSANSPVESLTSSEREIFYQVLLELKKDVQVLKKLLFTQLHKEPMGSQLIKEHLSLFQSISTPAEPTPVHRIDTSNAITSTHPEEEATVKSAAKSIQATPVPLQENLNLAQNEKELIIKALQKHNYKRKLATEELGIAERTLYRKIKEYGI